ncbi:hypothetical protein P7H00_04705 [Enterococcus pseudoavium]|uniref:Uncharacterized protein n=1 Tax=Enterococcus pseudoavium TaxID=44007 RepID=A0AAE4HZZ9_9ENTE|nr:hypothetical protein [Enterococcus pseudoavium]MDT2736433.1 hypothetical protein [Enterococcus pseudoavium]MDT2755452.1 hypothetical protein [Enterococcus pseudoavium]
MNQLLLYFFEASKIITGIFFVAALILFICLVIIKDRIWRYFRRRDY